MQRALEALRAAEAARNRKEDKEVVDHLAYIARQRALVARERATQDALVQRTEAASTALNRRLIESRDKAVENQQRAMEQAAAAQERAAQSERRLSYLQQQARASNGERPLTDSERDAIADAARRAAVAEREAKEYAARAAAATPPPKPAASSSTNRPTTNEKSKPASTARPSRRATNRAIATRPSRRSANRRAPTLPAAHLLAPAQSRRPRRRAQGRCDAHGRCQRSPQCRREACDIRCRRAGALGGQCGPVDRERIGRQGAFGWRGIDPSHAEYDERGSLQRLHRLRALQTAATTAPSKAQARIAASGNHCGAAARRIWREAIGSRLAVAFTSRDGEYADPRAARQQARARCRDDRKHAVCDHCTGTTRVSGAFGRRYAEECCRAAQRGP